MNWNDLTTLIHGFEMFSLLLSDYNAIKCSHHDTIMQYCTWHNWLNGGVSAWGQKLVFESQNYDKFWSISKSHFIKHKPLISEEC